MSPTPRRQLSVRDIERLASAGVKIELGTIDVLPDPYREALPIELADAIWQRWTRTNDVLERQLVRPYQLLATQYGDKVWVSVHPNHLEYEPFQLQDTAAIFPSDALMAQLALWEANHQ